MWRCVQIWAKYDSNDDGSIGFREVKDLMTEINEDIAPSDREVKMLVKVADADNSGTIDKQELRILIGRWFVLAGACPAVASLAPVVRHPRAAPPCGLVLRPLTFSATLSLHSVRVPSEEKNRKWNLANFNREVKQALQGCMHVDHVEQHAVVKSPGEKEANFWKNTTHNMVQNYSKPNTAAHSEIGSA